MFSVNIGGNNIFKMISTSQTILRPYFSMNSMVIQVFSETLSTTCSGFTKKKVCLLTCNMRYHFRIPSVFLNNNFPPSFGKDNLNVKYPLRSISSTSSICNK